jgi:mevalonate kinase
MPGRGSSESIRGFGAGKVILLGEHAVVYGHPALAAPLSWGVTATAFADRACRLEIPPTVRGRGRKLLLAAFNRAAQATGRPKVRIKLESDLPVSMGLGSSAAVAVACTRALFAAAEQKPTVRAVAQVALDMERVFHGNPSGIDPACSAHRKLILYTRSSGMNPGRAREIVSPRPIKVLVALVGKRDPTATTIAGLWERMSRWTPRYDRLLEAIGALAKEGARAIEDGDLNSLGDAMNVNQGLLNALQLSSPPIEEMVDRLRRAGALGS